MVLSYVNLVIIFIFGTFIGSFLNLVSDRVVKGEKIVSDRSKCDKCGKELKALNLIPVISFLMQKGKCSFCQTRLSWYYPFSEILSGLFLVFAASLSGFSLFNTFSRDVFVGFVFLSVVFSFYEILLLADLKYLLIPDKVVLPAIVFVALFHLSSTALNLYEYRNRLQNDDFGRYLLRAGFFENQVGVALRGLGFNFISAIAIALFFLLIVWITRGRGMGGGDIRLGLLVGLVNGFPYNLLAVFLGFFIGAVVSIVLILTKKKTLKSIVPFGPFLILGSLICLAWGSEILNWYFNLL
ncbi:hypothetical protein A2380_01860 [candidate division WWE3 bacterium RIFOXYB1_FULL_43_24]|uniref:Type 4 prepilin-like protein leader peptide-processing enzyme n=2 Tax=Katanobacteria TaxID=422282 RepID=A0A0G0YPN8_UNCKA|nr:MAG: Type 4 prepilin-like protein leader peptide-processing enzyme [candidate division WWE3 bacterium GW2011_GWA1_42_12]KKS34932.1 MAG: Type 4 prepilin-like protein leader peptide-processing enzyme [candidate division WWE3 bacterium GW2011_GWD1_42_14]KKS38635.1 MAG: Type 4 prepilin-like protein leader peptide-processing enzyme [candidate division WWE3 bacterium GW2011_GWF1_42_14]KKS40412.1 MAG: Type 4 prepilin-like protein leader peptide-processing enzyme [candidate division WWE3 bacterium GW